MDAEEMYEKETILESIVREKRAINEAEDRLNKLRKRLKELMPFRVGDKVRYRDVVGWVSDFSVADEGRPSCVYYYVPRKDGTQSKIRKFLAYRPNLDEIEVIERGE